MGLPGVSGSGGAIWCSHGRQSLNWTRVPRGRSRTYLRTLCTPIHHSAHEAPNVPLAQAAPVSLQANQLRELLGLWRGIRRAPGRALRELARCSWGGCRGSRGRWSCHGSGPAGCEEHLEPAAALCPSVRPGAFDPTQFPFLTSVPHFPSPVCASRVRVSVPGSHFLAS